ncbi:MAG: hypothetical protein WAR57_08620 [Candidatus Phosphoribacter sp.]
MVVIDALEARSHELVEEAVRLLDHRLPPPYKQVDREVLRRRLHQTMMTVTTALTERTPLPVIDYAREVARRCFHAGFLLEEVQTHFNALEETVWKFMVKEVDATHLPDNLAMVASIIGAIKDELGRSYVDLASRNRAPAINTHKLFSGTQSVPEHPMSRKAAN